MNRFFCAIAGVDFDTIKDCPRTDRIWAVQLGISLVLTFALVFGLAMYALSYFVAQSIIRVLVALLAASVLVLFDRALFQYDWFIVSEIHSSTPTIQQSPFSSVAGWLWLRIRLLLRLGVSVLIAYTLSVFAELAAFGGAIRERIEISNFDTNSNYRSQLTKVDQTVTTAILETSSEIEKIRREIQASRDASLRNIDRQRYDDLQTRKQATLKQISSLESRVEANVQSIKILDEDIDDERWGRKRKSYHTGVKGCDPGTNCHRYEGEKVRLLADNKALEDDLQKRRSDVSNLDQEVAEIFRIHQQLIREATSQRQKEINRLEQKLAELETSRKLRYEEANEELVRTGVFRPIQDDPLVRVAALLKMKSDPATGAAVEEISLLIKLLIGFLELAPVLAKVFFAPPTAYSARIRELVARGQVI